MFINESNNFSHRILFLYSLFVNTISHFVKTMIEPLHYYKNILRIEQKIVFPVKSSTHLGGCKSRGFPERVGQPRGRGGTKGRKKDGPLAGVQGVEWFVDRVA